MKTKSYPISVVLIREKKDGLTFSKEAVNEFFNKTIQALVEVMSELVAKDIYLPQEFRLEGTFTISGFTDEDNK